MEITVHIIYTGLNGNAKKFAEEMMKTGLVEAIRSQEGNLQYDYFFPMIDTESVLLIDRWKNQEAIDKHHKSDMMKQIAELRKKYQLKMKVQKFVDLVE